MPAQRTPFSVTYQPPGESAKEARRAGSEVESARASCLHCGRLEGGHPPRGVRARAGPLRGQVRGTQTGAGVKAGGDWQAGSGRLSAPAPHLRNWGEAASFPRGFGRHAEQAAQCTRTQ